MATAKSKTRATKQTKRLSETLAGISLQEQRFIDEFVNCYVGVDAVIAAGITDNRNSAKSIASRLLNRKDICEAIKTRAKRISERADLTAQRALQEAWGIVTADVNELVEFRRTCCRHCYGINYGYQRTVQEMSRDRAAYELKKRKDMKKSDYDPLMYEPFDEQGGIGFDARKAPNPDCQECFGEGVGNAHYKDTRQLSPEAKAIYAGVKQTKDGYQMLLVNKDAALEKLFKHYGLYKEDNKQKNSGLESLVQLVQSRSAKLPIKGGDK